MKRLAVRTCAVAGFLTLLISFSPVTLWWAEWLAGRWDTPQRGGTLVVLGADTMGPGLLGYSSYIRGYCSVRTWRQAGGFQRIIIVGRNASAPMRDYLTQHGIPSSAILIEEESNSTIENAAAARRLLQDAARPVFLLSSDFHMRRAGFLFEHAGLDVRRLPCPDGIKRGQSWSDRWTVASVLAYETFKLAATRLRPPDFSSHDRVPGKN